MTLFGDAAHPIVPFLGQGGCLSIEDGYVSVTYYPTQMISRSAG